MAAFTISLASSLILAQGHEAPAVDAAQFQQWFQASLGGKLEIPEAVQRRASKFRYVFVAGFHNERMRGYFTKNMAELRAHGVPRAAIHEIDPSSHKTLEENVDGIRDELRRIAGLGSEPLIVIAHSRGACDALAVALRNPKLIREHVARLFLIQGPFGGSAAADYVMGEGTPMDWRMAARPRVIGHLIGRVERNAIKRGKHAGLKELTRDSARDFWEEELDKHAEAIPTVAPRTYFIASQAHPSRTRPLHRPIARYVDTYYGPSDGFVTLDDQSLPDLGTHLVVLDAAHTELISGSPSTPAGRRARRALMECLIMAVGQATQEPSRDDP